MKRSPPQPSIRELEKILTLSLMTHVELRRGLPDIFVSITRTSGMALKTTTGSRKITRTSFGIVILRTLLA